MNLKQSVTTCLAKYATFSGRASRSEFWWFIGAAGAIDLLLKYGGGLVFSRADVLADVVSFAWLAPTLAVGSRRLHDVGRSGWWQLLVLTIIGALWLVLWCSRAPQQHDNKYGRYTAT